MYWLWGILLALGLWTLSLLYMQHAYAVRLSHIWLRSLGVAGYGAWMGMQLPSVVEEVFGLLFSIILLAGATIDQRYFILPDEGASILCVASLARWGLGYGMAQYDLVWLQALGVGLLFWLIRRIGRGGLGWGDIKWGIAIALWIPWGYGGIFIVLAFVLGSIVGLIQCMFDNTLQYCSKIPFGPYLALSGATIYMVTNLQLWL